MAVPNIFLSSTCYDLSSIRSSLESFLKEYGFIVLNSESKSFAVTPKTHSHNACLDQVRYADYLVLIIGSRRGGSYIGTEKTITNEEYNLAVKLGIPVIPFVDKSVKSQLITYKKNPQANFSHVVDDVRIFDFISYISSGHEDNWIHEYTNANEIEEILRAQFAYYLKLFAESLKPKEDKINNREQLSFVTFPEHLPNVQIDYATNEEYSAIKQGLFEVHRVITSIISSDITLGAKEEKLKTIWLLARYGENIGSNLRINEDVFKDRAWGSSKGERIFRQLDEFGVIASYDNDYDKNDRPCQIIDLSFSNVEENDFTIEALCYFISELLKMHDETSALELFKRADMRLFTQPNK